MLWLLLSLLPPLGSSRIVAQNASYRERQSGESKIKMLVYFPFIVVKPDFMANFLYKILYICVYIFSFRSAGRVSGEISMSSQRHS